MRLDQYMVLKGLAASRTKAQEMIERGEVEVLQDKQVLKVKSSLLIDESVMSVNVNSDIEKYVSRAGLKMEKALEHLKLNVEGKTVFDVGISTGGFTDCLLQNGATKVVGIDVGQGQLHPKIQKDERVMALEQTNARELLENYKFLKLVPENNFDLIVMDVSFVSLDKVIPSVSNFLAPGGKILALFKPQFEVGPMGLNKNGIAVDEKLIESAYQNFLKFCGNINLKVLEKFESGFPGRDGNREYFVFISK